MTGTGSEIIVVRFDALPPPHAHPGCKSCGAETGHFVRLLKSDGRPALRVECELCGKTSTTLDLPRSLLGTDQDLTRLPTINTTVEDNGLPPCVVCDQPSVEWHHWAPRAIFPDWPDLGVFMCLGCHVEWHARMRAHGLRWPGEQPAESILNAEDIPF